MANQYILHMYEASTYYVLVFEIFITLSSDVNVSSDTHQVFEIQNRDLCLDDYTIWKADWINNRDHIRIRVLNPHKTTRKT